MKLGSQSIPGLQNQAAGAVFAELLFFLAFEDAEGSAGEIGAINILGIEDITKFVTGKVINTYLFKPEPKGPYTS